MHLRKFVLLPLFEIDSQWLHPLLKKNIQFFLEKVKYQKIKKLKID
jgi:7,8-dihydro-6-hydroxymethylpterin-pyrophosphokinase